MSRRLDPVTTAMTEAIATTRSTCVLNPGFSRKAVTPLGGRTVGGGLGRPSWDKFVSCAVDRKQMLRICRIGFQLLAQFQDLIVHRPGSRIKVISPNFVQQN